MNRALVIAALCVVAPVTLQAQRRDAETRRIRAEYAGVLLQSKKYDAAIVEYRRLVSAEPQRFEYRLGLARALAWSNQHRAAETELARLRGQRPDHPAVQQLTRSVRAALDPSSGEARSWVAEEPAYLPYRIQLARAYAREERAHHAAAQFDTIFRSGGDDELAREAAAANVDAKRFAAALPLYRRALARAPADTRLRRDYARALWRSGDHATSIAQYDTLLMRSPSASWFVERAKLRVSIRDQVGAHQDLARALAMGPAAEAYLVRGELHRWNGRLGAARADYERALQLAPGQSLERELRNLVTFVERESKPSLGAAPEADVIGWTGRAELSADNTGFSYASAGGRFGIPIRQLATMSFGFEQRRVQARNGADTRMSYGFGGDVGATLGLPFARLSVRGGVLSEAGTTKTGHGSMGALAWWRSWRASAEVKRELAYPHLMTARALAAGDDDVSIIATRQIYSLGGSAGVVDFGVVADVMRLSDGNRRPALTTTVRYPVRDDLSALYVASDLRFREPSGMYWDPSHYSAHSLGIETSRRRDRGLSHMARLLAGVARSTPRPAGAGAAEATYAFHGAVEGEVTYRAGGWDAGLTSWYGRGRDGDYQRWGGSLRVRLEVP